MYEVECRKSHIQSYECQVTADCFGKRVAFDACLAKELFWLWDKGIITTGSCCGRHVNHDANTNAFISVDETSRALMLELGYKEFKHCHFYIKTNLWNTSLNKLYR